MNALLDVQELRKLFPLKDGSKIHAVEHVDIEVGHAETLAVVGESGCGKSTLAQLICRLLDADGGSVRLEGEELTGLSTVQMRPHRSKMQMIFQDPFASLDPRRTVGYSVAEPLIIHGLVKKREELQNRVAQLFERVGLLLGHMNQFPHQFSGGQRQRVCIARALALAPKLVIADEAVSALDVSVQAQVINLMMELQRDMGLSYLFITHDLAVVERMAHRVAVMYLGQIVEMGSRAHIFENPTHSYTKKLLQAAPIADPRQRKERALQTGEIPSPRWAAGQSPVRVEHVEIEPGHLVAKE